jgi:hypothetical protein
MVTLAYRGRALHLAGTERGHETMHDEAAVTGGLKQYGGGVLADRMSTALDGDHVSVKLSFNA